MGDIETAIKNLAEKISTPLFSDKDAPYEWRIEYHPAAEGVIAVLYDKHNKQRGFMHPDDCRAMMAERTKKP